MLPRFRPDYHNSSSQRTITHLAQMQRRRKWSSSGSRQSRGKSGSAACYAESLWLSGADSLPSFPRLGWKAQPSSRAEGVSQGGSPRKGEAFPHSRRRSRFGMLPFGDFDATLGHVRRGHIHPPECAILSCDFSRRLFHAPLALHRNPIALDPNARCRAGRRTGSIARLLFKRRTGRARMGRKVSLHTLSRQLT